MLKTIKYISLLCIGLISFSSCSESQIDSETCSHENYTKTVEKYPTCTEEGIISFVCNDCHYKWTQSIPMTEHNYVNGYCVDCGKEEPK